MHVRPMPLVKIAAAFDHPDWLFEIKHDGFRATAHVSAAGSELVSRNGMVFRRFASLAKDVAAAVGTAAAVLDGEVVCADPDGRANFDALFFRRSQPCFYAFDLLELDGEDLRALPLVRRKQRLRGLLKRSARRVLYVEHLARRGQALYRAACDQDLEGVVAKWRHGPYSADGVTTSWIKIVNPKYSQMVQRRELFEEQRDRAQRRRAEWRAPKLAPGLRRLVTS